MKAHKSNQKSDITDANEQKRYERLWSNALLQLKSKTVWHAEKYSHIWRSANILKVS